jgi:hypothetical protein
VCSHGAWFELGASIIGFVPGGDIAKGIAKSAQKAVTKTAVKVGAELADDAAKVIKGSTAAAADGLSSAKKTAGKVHAPRGPPTVVPANSATQRVKLRNSTREEIAAKQPRNAAGEMVDPNTRQTLKPGEIMGDLTKLAIREFSQGITFIDTRHTGPGVEYVERLLSEGHFGFGLVGFGDRGG